jgi:mannose-1-phosphate guanylyltransferase
MVSMECIILAGGYGTRLRPLTYTRQKVLIPVMNKPMIMHIIDALPESVDRVIVAANYKKEQIRDYFSKHDTGREIIINDEPVPLGTAGAVKHAEKYIDATFMVVNSDIVSSLDIGKFTESHRKKGAFATISLWQVDDIREFGVVSLEPDSRITCFVEKPRPEDAPSNLINSGHYCLDYETLDMIPKGRMVSMEKEIFPRIIAEHGRFFGYRFPGYWIDVGKFSNYILAHRMIMDSEGIRFKTGDNCNVLGKGDYSCIGNSVGTGSGSVLRNCVVFNDVKVGDGAIITDSVIGQGCRVGKGCTLKNVVLGDEHDISEGARMENRVVWEKPVPEGYPDSQVGNVIDNKYAKKA